MKKAASVMKLAGGPADVADFALVPWLCVTLFREVCSEQRYDFAATGIAAIVPHV
jgi:hypothetical protein